MGWSAGMGLGKDGRGRTDHVKQVRKKDNAGIGSKAGTRDEAFKASQELFNDVLARLSGGGGDGGGDAGGEAAGASKLGSAATNVRGVLARRQMSRRFCRSQNGDGGGVLASGGMASGNMASAAAMDEIFGRKSGGVGAGSSAEADGDAAADKEGYEKRKASELTSKMAEIESAISAGGYKLQRVQHANELATADRRRELVALTEETDGLRVKFEQLRADVKVLFEDKARLKKELVGAQAEAKDVEATVKKYRKASASLIA